MQAQSESEDVGSSATHAENSSKHGYSLWGPLICCTVELWDPSASKAGGSSPETICAMCPMSSLVATAVRVGPMSNRMVHVVYPEQPGWHHAIPLPIAGLPERATLELRSLVWLEPHDGAHCLAICDVEGAVWLCERTWKVASSAGVWECRLIREPSRPADRIIAFDVIRGAPPSPSHAPSGYLPTADLPTLHAPTHPDAPAHSAPVPPAAPSPWAMPSFRSIAQRIKSDRETPSSLLASRASCAVDPAHSPVQPLVNAFLKRQERGRQRREQIAAAARSGRAAHAGIKAPEAPPTSGTPVGALSAGDWVLMATAGGRVAVLSRAHDSSRWSEAEIVPRHTPGGPRGGAVPQQAGQTAADAREGGGAGSPIASLPRADLASACGVRWVRGGVDFALAYRHRPGEPLRVHVVRCRLSSSQSDRKGVSGGGGMGVSFGAAEGKGQREVAIQPVVVKEVMLEHLCPSGVESVALTPAISGSGLHVAIACIRRIESSSSVTVGLMDCASNYHLTWNRSLPAVCALESRLALAATHCSRMLQLTWDAPRKAPPGSEGPGTALEAPRPTAVVIGKGTQGLMRLPQGRGRFALSATGCLAAEATCHRGAVSVRVWSTLPAVFTVLDGEQSGDVDLGAVDEAMWKGSRKMAHYELAIAAMWSLVHRWSVSDAVVQMRAMLRIYPLLPHWNSFMMYVLRTGQMLDGMMKALDMVGAQQVDGRHTYAWWLDYLKNRLLAVATTSPSKQPLKEDRPPDNAEMISASNTNVRIDIQARILLAHLESGLVSISGACTSQRIGQTGILMDISRADLMALLRVQARYAELQDLILSAVSVWVAEKRAAEDPNTDKHQARQTFVAPPLVELLLQSDQCARIRSIDNIILNVLCRAKDMFKAEVLPHNAVKNLQREEEILKAEGVTDEAKATPEEVARVRERMQREVEPMLKLFTSKVERHTASSQQMRAIYHALLCKKGTSGESKAPPSPHTMGIMQLHRHFANETGPVDFDAVAAVFGNAPPADTSEAVTRRAAQVLSRPMELMIGRATSGHWNAIIRSADGGAVEAPGSASNSVVLAPLQSCASLADRWAVPVPQPDTVPTCVPSGPLPSVSGITPFGARRRCPWSLARKAGVVRVPAREGEGARSREAMPVADLSRAVGGLAGGLVGQKRGRGDDWAMSLPPPGIVLRDGKKDRMHRPAGALVGCVWCGSVGEVVDGHVSQDIGHLAVRGSGFGLLGCVWCGGGWEVLWEGAGAAGGTG